MNEASPGVRGGRGFALDPDYGRGALRRRIRLTRGDGYVLGELEDHAHAMRCKLIHDAAHIIAIEPEFHRIPMSTCPGAAGPLRSLIGLRHNIDAKGFFSGGRARVNCTHMLDLNWLAMRHVSREAKIRSYALDVLDEDNGLQVGTVHVDGSLLWTWQVREDQIIDGPTNIVGRSLFGGFVRWALGQLDGDELEAALALQKAFFIATARRFIMPPGPLGPAEIQANSGACFGYGSERIATARRNTEPLRDFTDRSDELLMFL